MVRDMISGKVVSLLCAMALISAFAVTPSDGAEIMYRATENRLATISIAPPLTLSFSRRVRPDPFTLRRALAFTQHQTSTAKKSGHQRGERRNGSNSRTSRRPVGYQLSHDFDSIFPNVLVKQVSTPADGSCCCRRASSSRLSRKLLGDMLRSFLRMKPRDVAALSETYSAL